VKDKISISTWNFKTWMKFTVTTWNDIQVDHRLTSVDINDSHPVSQWFLGAFYSIVVFQHTGHGIESQKVRKLQKKLSFLVHIPGNQESEDGLLLKLIFSVEPEISSQTWNFKSNLNFQVGLEISIWTWNLQ
jgi:hypothetical protein